MKRFIPLLLGLAVLPGCFPRMYSPAEDSAAMRANPFEVGVQLVIHVLPPTEAHYDDEGIYRLQVGDEIQAAARYIAQSDDFRTVTDHPGMKWVVSDTRRLTEVSKKPGRFSAAAPGVVRLGCVYTDPVDHRKYISNTIELEIGSGE